MNFVLLFYFLNFMFSQFSNFFFLYYSWLEIKKYQLFCNLKFNQVYLPSIRKVWFFKLSYLIKFHLYSYPKMNYLRLPFSFNKVLVINKSRVVENAAFNIVFPFFDNYYSFRSNNFGMYLRTYTFSI